jgi:DNA modification methylase
MQIKNRIKELRQVKASELLPNPRNWRKHPASQADALRGALAEIGYADALIAYETPDGLMLIDGHLRAETTPDMEVPVLVTDLDESEANKLLMTLDPLSAMASADTDTFDALRQMTTVDSDALQQMLDAITEGNLKSLESSPKPKVGLTDPDEVPPEPEEPWVQVGDLFQLGSHRLLCGDATSADDVAVLLGGEVPTIMVTDPPYGVSYAPSWRDEAFEKGQRRVGLVTGDSRSDWSEAWNLFRGNVVYCWSAEGARHITSGLALQSSGFEIRAGIIWRKPHFPLSRGHYTFQHEPCWYAVRKGSQASWIGPNNASTVWDIQLDSNTSPEAIDGGHSTQKPVECMERPIRYHEGDAYDPFLGSGTTLIACEKLDRICYGMEIEPRYVQVAIERWQNYTGQKAVKL